MRHTRPAYVALAAGLAGALAITLAGPAWAGDTDALLHKRLASPVLGTDFAMLVVDGATGEVVSEHRSDNPQMPASSMKVITAVTALATMQPDSAFTTTVLRGADDSGRIGLVLRGGGDPLLTRSDLQDLAADTAASLRQVPSTGARPKATLRVDRTLFPETEAAPGWTTSYIPYVAAPVQSLALLGDYSRDPSANAASAFAGYLRGHGVRVRIEAPVTEPTPADAQVLARSSEHDLGDAVRTMLSDSENNVAEVVHRQVALAKGLPADWSGAQQAAEAILRDLGLEPSGQQLMDGSGLSRKDRVTPAFLVSVLRHARVQDPKPFTTMFEEDALPVAGRTGTLNTTAGRFVTKHARCAVGQAQAKTGSLSDAIALAGTVTTVDGRERIFTMLVNHRPQQYPILQTRQVLDGLVATINGCWG